ncbi:MAG: DUF2236 domain-containing protein [Kofleriaceae bacterium]|nr:DUF2236 domain-containing protein [Kofleriaceae bacterium]
MAMAEAQRIEARLPGRSPENRLDRRRGRQDDSAHEPRRDPVGARGALARVRAAVADPRDGIHGPGSPAWQLQRESMVFLGGGRAALLQLAHPFVAYAIDQHSKTRGDVVGRFQRTFRNVFAMSFGTLDEATTAARRVHKHPQPHHRRHPRGRRRVPRRHPLPRQRRQLALVGLRDAHPHRGPGPRADARPPARGPQGRVLPRHLAVRAPVRDPRGRPAADLGGDGSLRRAHDGVADADRRRAGARDVALPVRRGDARRPPGAARGAGAPR